MTSHGGDADSRASGEAARSELCDAQRERWITSSAGLCHPGARSSQQDAALYDDGAGVFAVFDGMDGGQASELCREVLAWASFGIPSWDPRAANEAAIADMAAAIDGFWRKADPPGTIATATVALLRRSGGIVAIAHVGDCRVYRLRHDKLTRLTKDHTLEQAAAEAGMPSPAAPGRHTLLRALGGGVDGEATHAIERLVPGDRFLLCTDGVHEVLDDEAIALALRCGARPWHAASRLLDAVEAVGFRDNLGIVVVDASPSP